MMSGLSEVNHNLSVYTVGKTVIWISQFNAKNGDIWYAIKKFRNMYISRTEQIPVFLACQ